MVPPNEMDLLGVCHFESKKVQQHLAGKLSAVDVVPQKQIATVTEDTKEDTKDTKDAKEALQRGQRG